MNATTISKKLDMPLNSTIRILSTLTKYRILELDQSNRGYSIGPEMFRLGNLYIVMANFLEVASPVVKALNEMTKEVVTLFVHDRDKVTIVLREESEFSIVLHMRPGSALPAHTSSAGKVFLSELTEEEIDRIYPVEKLEKRTSKTIATKTELKLQLERIRQTGVSINKEEAHLGNIGIASLIRDVRGKAIASIAIGIPLFRYNEAVESRLAKLVRMAASLISYQLGYSEINNRVTSFEQIRSWWEKQKSGM